ncbi:hypothetical protein TA3x_005534 [Tundrisphaera sp. TA3]|uniref:hypothetical protein n=1 Tax=Tundrisphaera sp. TA3 TaxID=3435775 RepID=UPI003EC116CE
MSTHPTPSHADVLLEYHWEPQPAAGAWVAEVAASLLAEVPWAADFADRLFRESGNRFADLIDTVFLPGGDPRLEAAVAAGWEPRGADGGFATYDQPRGLFPTIAVGGTGTGVELKVESVADFLAAHRLVRPIEGAPLAPYRRAVVAAEGQATVSVAERHGTRGYTSEGGPAPADVLAVAEGFRLRRRDFVDAAEGFAEAERLIDAAIARVGRDYACDLFFAAEREYWAGRNKAAQAQKARQDRLGIGWANHDHHTYRSSRESFAPLVRVWEKLGLFCRERFYAGLAAGWGAQVMEHPVTRIVTFNDVDLSPEELMGDFSHDGLAPRDALATIGLWCGLHGEAFLQAGMHHLECVFSFDALKEQLEREHGIRTMKPFTDFAYLRQAFTEGERWRVDPARIDRLLARGLITPAQAEAFRADGAIGSHMENLERNDGFKGFNQHGVSEIIAATDPRRQVRPDAFDAVDYETVGSH